MFFSEMAHCNILMCTDLVFQKREKLSSVFMIEKFLLPSSNFIDTECKSRGRSVTELAMELVAMVQLPPH